MVSKRLKAKVKGGGTLVLDAQGLSLHVDGDELMRARIKAAEQNGRRVALSALTPLEVRRTGQAARRLNFVLSRFDVKPVDEEVLQTAGRLLDSTGLDGHECLVDAIVVATAALCTPPVRLVTSDRSHIPKLCAAAQELPSQSAIGLIGV
ncbi:type II toxin-antitoxin system VapC family toxin [Streptomyces sp. bgisy153]|uniref:type II toxin-antitoxin system VapC family toxin n=1 Tax=Streptomyces sp. bgisy153 TaxID=3413793 RepID=UPI003D73CAEB